jgi:hypothetical protein
MDKRLKQTYLQRSYTNAEKPQEGGLTSLIIREMEIENLTATMMAPTKKTKRYKCGRGDAGTFVHCGWGQQYGS